MNENSVADAIDDLIRVVIALNSEGNRADVVRRLITANVKQARIAKLFDMPAKDVSSIAAKQRRAGSKK